MLKGGTKDEAQRKAALTFLKFLWDNDGEWARTGHLPANKTALDSAAFRALPMRRPSATGYSTVARPNCSIGSSQARWLNVFAKPVPGVESKVPH